MMKTYVRLIKDIYATKGDFSADGFRSTNPLLNEQQLSRYAKMLKKFWRFRSVLLILFPFLASLIIISHPMVDTSPAIKFLILFLALILAYLIGLLVSYIMAGKMRKEGLL